MGRFFWSAIAVAGILMLLFFPIYFESDAHADLNRKKFAFAVYLYGKIKLFGGYVTSYPGGLAVHLNEKKAVLMPYKAMDAERKKFSFVKSFRLKYFTVTTETGAEYLMAVAMAHTALKTAFYARGGEKEHSRLWVTDGDVLKVSTNLVAWFNGLILLRAFIQYLKEK